MLMRRLANVRWPTVRWCDGWRPGCGVGRSRELNRRASVARRALSRVPSQCHFAHIPLVVHSFPTTCAVFEPPKVCSFYERPPRSKLDKTANLSFWRASVALSCINGKHLRTLARSGSNSLKTGCQAPREPSFRPFFLQKYTFRLLYNRCTESENSPAFRRHEQQGGSLEGHEKYNYCSRNTGVTTRGFSLCISSS